MLFILKSSEIVKIIKIKKFEKIINYGLKNFEYILLINDCFLIFFVIILKLLNDLFFLLKDWVIFVFFSIFLMYVFMLLK